MTHELSPELAWPCSFACEHICYVAALCIILNTKGRSGLILWYLAGCFASVLSMLRSCLLPELADSAAGVPDTLLSAVASCLAHVTASRQLWLTKLDAVTLLNLVLFASCLCKGCCGWVSVGVHV